MYYPCFMYVEGEYSGKMGEKWVKNARKMREKRVKKGWRI